MLLQPHRKRAGIKSEKAAQIPQFGVLGRWKWRGSLGWWESHQKIVCAVSGKGWMQQEFLRAGFGIGGFQTGLREHFHVSASPSEMLPWEHRFECSSRMQHTESSSWQFVHPKINFCRGIPQCQVPECQSVAMSVKSNGFDVKSEWI